MTHQHTLLIVDDSTENLKLLGNSLKNAGFNILAALNGKQALALAVSKLPDLILLDVMMPEMNGFEVCEALKENHLTNKIPVVFLTASIEPESIKTGFASGGVDYIAKPFNPEELILRMKNHLAQKTSKDILERELKYKSSLLKNISDGIMSPVSELIKNIKKTSADPSPELLKDHLKQIEHSAEKIRKLSNNLSDLAEMETYSYKAHIEDFRLCEVFENQEKGYDNSHSKPVKVRVALSGLEDHYVGDKKKFQQAILQITNVLRQSKKGLISINAYLKERAENSDTISIDFLGAQQGDISETDESYFSDREIGLLIAKELLRFVDGKITNSSSVNSAFSIEVALQRVKNPKPWEKEKYCNENLNGRLLEKKNILVVEDNELNQRLIESVLQSYGANICIAHNGKEALEKVLQKTYHLILMDVNVPVINGIEATTILRREYNISTPIIAISGHSDKASIKRCIDSGMNSFLLKPFEIGDLQNIILQELEKQPIIKRQSKMSGVPKNQQATEEVSKYSLSKIIELANGDEKLLNNWMDHFRALITKGRHEIDLIIAAKHYEAENKIFHELNNYTSYFGVDLLREYLKDLPKIQKSCTNEELMAHFGLIAEELNSIDTYFSKTSGNKK